MASRLGWFVLGMAAAIVLFGLGAYVFVRSGGVAMATTAAPLPLERTVANLALNAAVQSSLDLKNPRPLDEADLVAGAHVYHQNCAVCHGAPGAAPTAIANGMFPNPPQLFMTSDMITDDPQGETYWKVTNGIRLSGMPGFAGTLSDTERWQVTMLVANADKLPATVQAALH
jgi:thiosulfate dehydrogenase